MKSGTAPLGVLLCAFAMQQGAVAQHRADSIGTRNHLLTTVTVEAQAMPAAAMGTAPVQTMDGIRMADLGLQSVADAAMRFAGTNVRDYGGIGGLKTVSVRNMGATHTAVSYDGIVVSNTQAGPVDIGMFAIENVGSVSLAVGQPDDMLQSARACASAAVLDIGRARPSIGRRQTKAGLNLRGGSFGYATAGLVLARCTADSSVISANAGYCRADGIYPFRLVNGQQTTTERRTNSDVGTWHAEVDASHALGPRARMEATAFGYDSRRGLPGAVRLYNSQSDERMHERHLFVQTTCEHDAAPRWQMKYRAKYTFSGNRYEDFGAEYPDGRIEENYRQNELYASAAARWTAAPWLTAGAAQDMAVASLWSDLAECPMPTRYASTTAARLRGSWARATADLMLVATLVTDRVEKGERPRDKRNLAPSVGLRLRPWDVTALYVRALCKSTYRIPTFNDLYYYRMGNRTVRPEKAVEYNLGLAWHGALPAVGGRLTITADVYHNDVKDKIVAFPGTYVWRTVNYGRARIRGIDATVSAGIGLGRAARLDVDASGTVQEAVDVEPTSATHGCQLAYTPKRNGSVQGVLTVARWSVGYSLTAVGKRYYMAQNKPEYQIKGYTEQSVSIAHRRSWGRTSVRLQAEVRNMADRQYEVVKFYPMPGRAFNVNANINF